MVTHSSILVRKILWTEEPATIGGKELDATEQLNDKYCDHQMRKIYILKVVYQHTPVFQKNWSFLSFLHSPFICFLYFDLNHNKNFEEKPALTALEFSIQEA